MLDHPSINFYFCIERDTRSNYSVPNNLSCIIKKSYIINDSPNHFKIYNSCPSSYVDVSTGETIYNK